VGLREVGLREVGLREVGLREVGLREVGFGSAQPTISRVFSTKRNRSDFFSNFGNSPVHDRLDDHR
jgi:hypothetical protein